MTRALVIPVEPERWSAAYRLANTLRRAGVPVAWATQSFDSGGRAFSAGTFVLPLQDDAHGAWVSDAAARSGAAMQGPLVLDVPLLPLGVPRIGIYGGGGAPYNYARILAALGFPIEFVQPEAIRRGALWEFDVFMMPGGGQYAMKGQLDPLGQAGCRAVAEWVRDGGMFIGSCAGSFNAAIVSDSFVTACPAQRSMRLVNARVWNSLDTEWIGLASPGVGVLRARVVQRGHPVTFHLPDRFEIVHYNGPWFEPIEGAVDGASEPESLAVVEGVGEAFTPSEYFLRFSAYAGVPGPETLVARGVASGVRTVIAGHLDRGRVVLFGSHPEFGLNLLMDRAGLPALMLANSVLWQSSTRPDRRIRMPESGPVEPSLQEGVDRAQTSAGRIHDLAAMLRRRPLDPLPAWLQEDVAMSTFGLAGRQIWTRTLAEFDRLLGDLDGELRRLLRTSGAVLQKRSDGVRAALHAAVTALHYRVPEEWRRDFGYEGLLQGLERCERMLTAALSAWDAAPPPSPNPYAHFATSPYHLAAGSYLAASGVLAGACGLAAALADQLEVERTVAELTGRSTAAGA